MNDSEKININREVEYRLEHSQPHGTKYIAWLGVIIVIGTWEIAARGAWVPALYLPAPTAIFAELIRLMGHELSSALLASARRWLVGVGAGSMIGIFAALLCGTHRNWRAALEPWIHFLYPIPKIAILPLIILWLGIGEVPKYVVIALGALFPVFLTTMEGIDHVPRIYYEVVAIYPVSRMYFLRKILVPAIVPSIFAGLRLATGTGLVLLVAAEMIAADTGLGALILHYGDLMLTTSLMACVLLLAFIGLVLQKVLTMWENYLLRWRQPH